MLESRAASEGEGWFRHLTDSAPVMIWTAGLDKLCDHFNLPWLEFTGRSLEEEIGNGWAGGVHPDDSDACLATYVNSFDARQPFEMEYRLRRHDGEYRWLLDHGVPRYASNGEFIGYIGSCIDITDRKESEARTQTTNRLLTTVSEVSAIIVRSEDPVRLLKDACRIFVDSGGFDRAWAGSLNQESSHIVPVAWAGIVTKDFASQAIPVEEASGEFGAVRRALQTGGPALWTSGQEGSADGGSVESSPEFLRGSVAVFPLERKGRLDGVFVLHSGIELPPEKQLIGLLEKLVANLGFAADALDDRASRSQAEKDLRRLSRAVEQSPVAVLITDASGQIEYVNPRFSKQTGYQASDVLGKNPRILKSGLTPPETYRDLWETVTAGREWHGELCNRKRDGNLYWEDAFIAPVKAPDGSITAFVAVKDDVTERRIAAARLHESEQMLRLVLDTVPQGVFWKDLDSRLLGCNRTFVKECGAQGAAFLVGKNAFEVASGNEALLALLEDASVVTRNAPELGREVAVLTREGSARWLRSSKVPLHDKSGEVMGVLTVYEDITQERLLEDEFRQAQKMETVGRLAGGIAHDFSNLLTVMLGYSELLEAAIPETDPRRSSVAEIRKAAERGGRLTKQLLAFSRRHSFEPGQVDVSAIVGETETMLRRLIGEDITFDVSRTPEPALIRADMGEVEQLLVNLVVNARDAMPSGGSLRVEVATIEDASLTGTPNRDPLPPGKYVMLSVKDTGTGMTERVRAHLFEPFFTTKDPGKGTGLGLATVYSIVKRSQGAIFVDSEPGQGTCFHLYFPVFSVRETDGTSTAAHSRKAPVPRPDAQTILLVDDDAAVRELAARLLEGFGYRVLRASGGDEAVRILADLFERIHLLVTDVVMPSMSGPDLARRARKLRPEIRIVLASGYPDGGASQTPVEGIAAILQKPFTPDMLERAVREALDRPK